VYVVIMGCGRVGSALSAGLERLGHEVAVIDKDAQAFRRLGPDFRGKQVIGQGFHREVMIEAGVERAQAFAAVSSGDNSNIISARVARETFGIEHVVARIYDAKRAAVYERLGIPTVATVRWTADQMLRKLLPESAEPQWRDATGKIILTQVAVSPAWIGEPVKLVEASVATRIAYIDRLGEAIVPQSATVLQHGDVVHVIARESDMERVVASFAKRDGSGQ
jgi:trk system potassium uptake protein